MTKMIQQKSESLEIFARLLSRENIHLSIQNVDTAYFIHNTRELVLPKWSHLSVEAFQGLCIHEVGHALFTPMKTRETMVKAGLTNNCYAVLEDAYIERRMKVSYPGARKMLQTMNAELWDIGFFGQTPVAKRSFLDRANLFYKVGHHVNIPFTDEEFALIEMGMGVTRPTYLSIGLKMDAMQKSQRRKEEPTPPPPAPEADDDEDTPKSFNSDVPENDPEEPDFEPEGGPAETPEEDEDFEPAEQDDESEEEAEGEGPDGSPEMNPDLLDDEDFEKNEDEDEGNQASGESGEENDEDELETDEPPAGSSESEELDDEELEEDDGPSGSASNPDGEGSESFEDDEDEDDEPLESFSELEKNLANDEDDYLGENKEMGSTNTKDAPAVLEHALMWRNDDFLKAFERVYENRTFFDRPRWATPLKPLRKLASHLSSVFEIKKSAAAVANAKTSDTGCLDVTQLHRALYDTEIFAEESILYQAQNHGMVLLIDCSYSMQGTKFTEVVRRAIILGMFCRASKVPFSVVGFTSGNRGYGMPDYDHVDYGSCELMEFLSSDQTELNFNKSCAALLNEARMFANGRDHSCSIDFCGTPLAASLLLMREFIKQFNEANQTEKLTFVVLNDGDSSGLTRTGDSTINLIDAETGVNMTDANSSRKVVNSVIKAIKLSIPGLNVQNVYATSRFNGYEISGTVREDVNITSSGEAVQHFPGEAYDNIIVFDTAANADQQSEKLFVNAFMEQFA